MVDIYRRLAHSERVPPGKHYWCLCGKQSARPNSEINQMVSLGLIRPDQFHGVDRSLEIISRNRKIHPKAKFYCGEWLDILALQGSDFNPEMVYLDTQATAGDPVAPALTVPTMMLCPKGAVLFVNVALKRIYNKKVKPEVFRDDLLLSTHSTEIDKWEFHDCFTYEPSKTPMATYILRKIQ